MGLFDKTVSFIYNLIKRDKYNKNKKWKKEIRKGSDKTVIFFLGYECKISYYELLYLRFSDYTKIIYQLPNVLLGSDPKTAKESYKEIIKDISKVVKNYKDITCYGISLGTVFACHTANKFNTKLILSFPFDKISSVMWDSCLLKPVKKQAIKQGFSKKDFDRELGEFDPINNVNVKKAKVIIASGDSIVNSSKLVKAMKADIIKIPFFGHYLGSVIGLFC